VVTLAVDIGVIVAGLILIGRMSVLRALLAWVYRFTIQLHIVVLLLGLVFVGQSILASGQSMNTGIALIDQNAAYYRVIGILCLLAALAPTALWMASALAGAENLSLVRALLVAWIELLIFVPIFFLGEYAARDLVPDWEPVYRMLAIGGVILVGTFFVVVFGVRLLSATRMGSAVWTWIWRMPLYLLFAALCAGLELVGMGINQSGLEQGGPGNLVKLALAFEGIVGGCLLLFAASSANRPAVRTRSLA
jgi:hypothetical protein